MLVTEVQNYDDESSPVKGNVAALLPTYPCTTWLWIDSTRFGRPFGGGVVISCPVSRAVSCNCQVASCVWLDGRSPHLDGRGSFDFLKRISSRCQTLKGYAACAGIERNP